MLRQALVVGINNYHSLQNLKTPAGNADMMAKLLQKHGGFQVVTRLPVKDNEGLLSVDENPSPQELVTATTLQEAIAENIFMDELHWRMDELLEKLRRKI
ncbi:caspase family protein [Anabaena cylindrica UHCC 0172]|uniref:caspase family protein n=1 Tax=Anabaena cylindrica TaxID=1165 RepID=UPI002B2141E6|nr:caspase family protein [Anabaena cylindrica]MEA5553657.1 caspase family protein [Anabaena cylindrica UHCC 0172]